MSPLKILLVEDDPHFRGMLSCLLSGRDREVLQAASGQEGLARALAAKPDLIVMDWALGPGLQGIEVCSRLKKNPRTRRIPIVVLTGARVRFEDELSALSHGADLYLTKAEVIGSWAKTARFLAYLRALARRPFRIRDDHRKFLLFPDLEIDLARHTVRTRRELISDLSTKQFDLLYVLAKRHPRAVSRRFLLRSVWRNCVRDKEVEVAICRLKTRLEKGKEHFIESIRGKGYRLSVSPIIASPKTRHSA